MNIEYEATFPNIDKEQLRLKLKEVGAKLVKKEFLQKRHTFHFPKSSQFYTMGWMRVRDEDDKITMTLKIRGDDKEIDCQKELEIIIDNYDTAREMLKLLGCQEKAFQETKREVWDLDGVEIMLDEWPFLEPLVEIEGRSEKAVKRASEKLNFNYAQAVFGPVGILYSQKYGISEKIINDKIKTIVFKGENPFLKKY
jgi:adenylate cyclase class 2